MQCTFLGEDGTCEEPINGVCAGWGIWGRMANDKDARDDHFLIFCRLPLEDRIKLVGKEPYSGT